LRVSSSSAARGAAGGPDSEERSMREYAVPSNTSLTEADNLTEPVWRRERQTPDLVAFQRYVNGRWVDVTSKEFAAHVRAAAKGLIAAGVQAGDRVSIFADTRYDWTLADYAIMAAGAATVPIYPSSSEEQVEWILSDSAAVGVFCASRAHVEKVDAVKAALPDLANVWSFDAGAIETLIAAGRDVPDSAVEERVATLHPDSLATLIYTSGTTGRPKGCDLTHGNLVFECRAVLQAASDVFEPGNKTLLFLPIAHIFGKVIQCACVEGGITVGHYADVSKLIEIFPTFGPHFILSVPRVFEKIYNGAKALAHQSGFKGKVFDFAEQAGIEYSRALDSPGGPSGLLKVKHAVADRLVFSTLRTKMGGNVKYAISGGAPLGERLGHFYRGAGITILEGYGLTETAAAATVNLPDKIKIGSVGAPVPGMTVRIADDGEILIKGPVVFRGYWNNAEATQEAIDADGWFHSGDIGTIDANGFVAITGRKKELIVTAGGKNVAPAVLEDRINAHPLISMSMVVGDAKPFIACLVTIDPEAFPKWKSDNGKPADATVAQLTDDYDLREVVQAAIDDANRAVSKAESIRKFEILPVDFTEEGGEITPTLKLKRNVVMQKYAAAVESLYS
jgi:long-chain acyl-CoA synthetase